LDLRYISGALFKEKIMSKKDELFTDINLVSNKYGVDINIPDVVRAQLKAYSQRHITAENAAWEIQQMNVDGFLNPSVSEVIVWSRNAGYGIPNPPDEEVAAQVEKAWKKFHPEKL
jgi:hypothetical protein